MHITVSLFSRHKIKNSVEYTQAPLDHTMSDHTQAIFHWAAPLPIQTVKHANEVGIFKSCLMREGQLNDKRVMTKEGIISGSGALRAVASIGHAICDIDHFGENLPEKYIDKYPGLAGGIVGHVLDCQAVTAPDGLTECQATLWIENKTANDLISKGVIRHCSVVDMPRKLVCDKGQCSYEGSAFLFNTLALEGVANCPDTWIAPITEIDQGTIIQAPRTQTKIMHLLQQSIASSA